jgi:hypothetical protein
LAEAGGAGNLTYYDTGPFRSGGALFIGHASADLAHQPMHER